MLFERARPRPSAFVRPFNLRPDVQGEAGGGEEEEGGGREREGGDGAGEEGDQYEAQPASDPVQ